MKIDLEITEETWRLRVVIESKRKRRMDTEILQQSEDREQHLESRY